MRIEDVPGFYFHMEQISPEVRHAQRMAELKQMAAYRALRLQAYKDWADTEKRNAIKAQYALDESEDRKKLDTMPADLIAVRTQEVSYNLTMIRKPEVKLTLWQKIKKYFRFERS